MFFRSSSGAMPRPDPDPAPPRLEGMADGSVQAGATWALRLTATTYNAATPQWELVTYPAGMTITASGATATLAWAPGIGDVHATPYTVAVRVSDGVRATTGSLRLLVTESPAAVLSVQALPDADIAGFLDGLEGQDWVYYGPGFASDGANPTARKAGVDPVMISAFDASTQLLNATVASYVAPVGRAAASWSGGTPAPVATVSGMIGSFLIAAGGVADRGFSIPIVASDSEVLRALVLVSIRQLAKAQLSVTCPGSETKTETMDGTSEQPVTDRLYQIRFRRSGAGNLVVNWRNTHINGAVALRAIAVTAATADGFVVTPPSPVAATVGQVSTVVIEYDTDTASGLTLTSSGVPDGADLLIDGLTATLTYLPPTGADTTTPSPTIISVMRDGVALDSTTINYTVDAAVDPLTLDVGDNPFEVTVGAANEVTMTPDGGTSPYRFSAWPLPGASSFDPATGLFEWALADAGDVQQTPYATTVTLTDDADGVVTAAWGIKVLSAAGGVLQKTSTQEFDTTADTGTQQSVNFGAVGTYAWWHITKDTATPPAIAITSTGPAWEHTINAAHWARSTARAVWRTQWTTPAPARDWGVGLLATGPDAADTEIVISPLIGTTEKEVSLYFGYLASACTVTLAMSDGSGSIASETFGSTATKQRARKIVYRAKGTAADARLVITIKKLGTTGSLYLTGVTIANAA